MHYAKALTIIPDEHLQTLISQVLTGLTCHVREATGLTSAMQCLSNTAFDLLLLDLQAPTFVGLDVLHDLQMCASVKKIPCVFVSAYHVDAAIKDLAEATGAAAVIEVDSEFELLSKKLLKTLSEPFPSKSSVLTNEEFYHRRRDLLIESLHEQSALLSRSEASFRDMVENTSDWIWEFDENFVFTYVSPKVRDLLGYEPDELIGTSAFDPMSSDEAERVENAFLPIAKARKPFQGLVNVNRHKDGHAVVIESSGVPVFAPDGSFKGYRGVDRDITERQRMQDILRLTQACVDQASEAVFRVDQDGRFLYVNQSACQGLGYSAEELLHLTVFDIDPLIDRATWQQHWVAHHAEGGRKFESIHRRKDGQEFPVEIVIDHITYDNQEFHHAYIRDISEHKRSQQVTEQALDVAYQALEEADQANERVRAILKSVPYGLIVTDPEQRITLVSISAQTMLGKTRQELSGRQLADVLNSQACIDMLTATLRGEEQGAFIDVELFSHEFNETRDFRIRTALVRTPQGRDIGGLVIFADVTLDRELDRMKTEFISAAAHELNTPLTSIIGFLELLINGSMEQKLTLQQQQRYLNLVFEKSLHLSDIVRDLLDIGRVETGRGITLNLEVCQIESLIRETVSLYEQGAQRHQFHVEYRQPTADIQADSSRLVQILENLLSNAVKYSPKGGSITISAQPQGREYWIAIADQGIGMSSEQVERIFEKFYRADTLGPLVGGLGLGMSIVKGMVEAHGGRIWVESEPESGTTVTFTLPMS